MPKNKTIKKTAPKNKGGRPKNCGRCNKSKTICKCGRPTVMTKDVIAKLEQAFMMGCPDIEACLYADISMDALYLYQRKNPQFINRKEKLKKTPNFKARKTLVEDVDTPTGARWWGERKMKEEFQPSQVIEHQGKIDLSKEADKRAQKYE